VEFYSAIISATFCDIVITCFEMTFGNMTQYLHGAELFFEKLVVSELVKDPPHFMDP
jgi:hypothetical protein